MGRNTSNNPSAIVIAELRLSEENNLAALRKAISEGIESGRAVDFDPKKHLGELKTQPKTSG